MSWPETKLLMDAIVENGIASSNGTIIMVPMDANKYGYNMKILDIDGITPLQDVKINGVTDPSTEIRTNANGVAKFISGSPSHSVTFSEFPAGYQYAGHGRTAHPARPVADPPQAAAGSAAPVAAGLPPRQKTPAPCGTPRTFPPAA